MSPVVGARASRPQRERCGLPAGVRFVRAEGAHILGPVRRSTAHPSARLGSGRGGRRGAAGAQARTGAGRRDCRASPSPRRSACRWRCAASRMRDVAVCALQMWAYIAAYKSPHDDPDAQERRTHFDYPIAADRALGLGELPTVRLQRALARVGADGAEWRALDRVLVWTHWVWFAVPHGTVAYVLLRRPERFARAAAHDLRGLRPRRELLLGCSRRRRRGTRRPSARLDGRRPGRAADDGRVRRALLA